MSIYVHMYISEWERDTSRLEPLDEPHIASFAIASIRGSGGIFISSIMNQSSWTSSQ